MVFSPWFIYFSIYNFFKEWCRTAPSPFDFFLKNKIFFTMLFRDGRIRPDPRKPSDLSGSESDLIWFFKKIKLIWSYPNSTWPDPIRDQMTFNPIEIYQRSKKNTICKLTRPWFDPTRPDFFQKVKLKLAQPESGPTRTRPNPPHCHL
jgi:hypothetical protein